MIHFIYKGGVIKKTENFEYLITCTTLFECVFKE